MVGMGKLGNLLQLLVVVMHVGRRRGGSSRSFIRTTFIFRIHSTMLVIISLPSTTTRSIFGCHVHDRMTHHVEFVGTGLRCPLTGFTAIRSTNSANHNDRIARMATTHQIMCNLYFHMSRRSSGIPILVMIHTFAILQVLAKLFSYLLNLELLYIAKISDFSIQHKLLTPAFRILASRGRGVLSIHEFGDLLQSAFGADKSCI
mmetsp:Transcript_35455/g.63901  ORF Transcript_35455/g.63901 Transcript_35455/m.63901 type:complete len:203 (+) Transcript_35455:621-1229(+)